MEVLFDDLLELAKDFMKNLVNSRIFALSLVFFCMFCILIVRLFDLQIINGQEYLDEYIHKTKKTVSTASTRGNIYDRNGTILAYNELAYSVTIQDTGAYPKDDAKNNMLLRLIQILEKHQASIQGKFEVMLDQDGNFIYTSQSEASKNRFLRDYYGLKSTKLLDDANGKYPSNITAKEVFEKKKKAYRLDSLKDAKGNPVVLSDEDALRIVNIRYTMGLTAYQKYETTTVASNVSKDAVAEVLENTADLQGVTVEEVAVRNYNDSIYFSSIIGYTGKVQEDQLEDLKAKSENYELSDIVGRTGIELSMELDLQGIKGSRTMFVDNVGRILEVTEQTDSVAGNDVYLTIDRDLQVGIYNLLEQQLAGVLVDTLVNREVDTSEITDSSKIKIPIKDAYFQLINNNVLSLKRMASEDASPIEQAVQQKYLHSKEEILNNIRNELMSTHPTAMIDLPPDMVAYMAYIYNYLSSSDVAIILKDNIDMNGEEYLAWKNDTISLREYLYTGIANSWIDTTKLKTDDKYSNADEVFQVLVDYVIDHLKDDSKFTKRIYRYLINNNVVSGRELCLILYAQEVIPYEEAEVAALTANDENYAFSFLIKKISNIDITPAQLALDPCTAACVVTDVNNGEVLALVSYPSYDNNRLSGTVDSVYYNQLQEDLSLPLYNNATQAKKAPGSTFKPIAAIAALEERVVSINEQLMCTGIYEEVDSPIKCWIYPGYHGLLDMVGGIQNSCNCYFTEIAHRLSTDETGIYSTDKGLSTLQKYATMFGLDHLSGIELLEVSPEISTKDPERSSMGQGTNSYANIQLSRYVATLANRGDVYELSLIDKLTDSQGTLIHDYTPTLNSHIDIQESTWDTVQTGMRGVIENGSAKKIFKDLEVDIAGKTGTAQESKNRGNHAFFISYAPYNNPDICVTVNIPYGYTSSNAATIAKNVYRFYYGYKSLDEILNNGALEVSDVKIVE